jgi:hypothetical protein
MTDDEQKGPSNQNANVGRDSKIAERDVFLLASPFVAQR